MQEGLGIGTGTRRRRLALLTAPLAALAASALAGNLLVAALVHSHPLVLLALNATTRHLVLTATTVDPVPYVLVALVRRSLENPFLYLLGRWYGDDAVAWIDRRAGGGWWLRPVQRGFRTWGIPIVALFPGGVVCVLAGASGMHWATFATLTVVGTLATVLLIRSFGGAISGPVELLVEFAAQNWVWLTVLTVALAGLWWRMRRRPVRPGMAPQ